MASSHGDDGVVSSCARSRECARGASKSTTTLPRSISPSAGDSISGGDRRTEPRASSQFVFELIDEQNALLLDGRVVKCRATKRAEGIPVVEAPPGDHRDVVVRVPRRRRGVRAGARRPRADAGPVCALAARTRRSAGIISCGSFKGTSIQHTNLQGLSLIPTWSALPTSRRRSCSRRRLVRDLTRAAGAKLRVLGACAARPLRGKPWSGS